MRISISEEHLTECNGRFTVTLNFSHDGTDPVPVRVAHGAGFDVNVQNIAVDPARVTIAPGAIVRVVVTGELTERCDKGEFQFEWVQTVQGQDIGRTRDGILIVVASVPFQADDVPDPVTADPNGEFEYEIDVVCCGGAVAGAHNVDFRAFAGGNVASMQTQPPASLNINCPGGGDTVTVSGILSDPTKAGVAEVRILGRGRCFVATDIQPNARPDPEAHRQAIQEWGGGD